MKFLLAAAAAILIPAGSAAAQDDSWSLDGYVGGVSDYRDRGISLSDRDPAALASLGLFHDGGFYLGMDAATIDGFGDADARAEFYAGYSIDRGDFIYDLSVELDTIHGDSSQFYPEFRFSAARDFGLAYTRAGVAYAPGGRWSNPSDQSVYVFGDLEIPVPTQPWLTIIGSVGHDVRSDSENLWDWSAGLSAFVGDFEVTATYMNSEFDGRLGRGRFVAGIRLFF